MSWCRARWVPAFGFSGRIRESCGDGARELAIPWDLVERDSHDRGSYIVVLRLPKDRKIEVGSLGNVKFQKGYYLYAGSAMKDLGQRLARHQRLTKKMRWHIDHLREHAEFVAGIPIRSSLKRECEIASALSKFANGQVPGFGSSDCTCPSHLFAMRDDPFRSRAFRDLLLYFRMGKLEEELRCRSAGMSVSGRGKADHVGRSTYSASPLRRVPCPACGPPGCYIRSRK